MSALIWSPFADKAQVTEVAKTLLDEQLIACVNLITIDSIFLWQGKIDEAAECAALFKTDADLLDQAVQRIEELHPYETPAVLGWKCDSAAKATKAWLGALGLE